MASVNIKIISGGQAGVDRVALDFALTHGLDCGGWCPRGRRAEDGQIPERYPLQETNTPNYPERTRRNIQNSDATLLVTSGHALTGGSRLTYQLAVHLGKPILHLYPGFPWPARLLKDFLRKHLVQVLNVAGTRASRAPKLGDFVAQLLQEVCQ